MPDGFADNRDNATNFGKAAEAGDLKGMWNAAKGNKPAAKPAPAPQPQPGGGFNININNSNQQQQ
ncbi:MULTISPECIES: hypothetical protein [unclassified Leifsonia]|uniref:hypothetical protein n=1 Tax=unclassified Leifsonia TaxID=2663824 RepID=UPI0006F40294|nr:MULTISPECIES: hypothetical protein [unclassified Leifsonia]KQX07207.1 hypothetical protein ASC59_05265 [Leifsonia sp. Root1293]KRA11490.1 hypothetical protein ASD61_05265 [Leifsonia sp. Root60]